MPFADAPVGPLAIPIIGTWEIVGWGLAGGAFAELLAWFQLRQEPALPIYLRSAFYWSVTGLMVLAGGLLALAYVRSGSNINPILALNVGASAPLVLRGLVAQAPKIPPGRID